jgi:hypothetical protein
VRQLFKPMNGKAVDRTAGPGFGGIRYSHIYSALVVQTFEGPILASRRNFELEGWDRFVADYSARVLPEHQLKGSYFELSVAHEKKDKLRRTLLAHVFSKSRNELKAND